MLHQGEEVTSDYSIASAWAAEFLGRPNVATVWIPEKDFFQARRTAASFSLSRVIHKIAPNESVADGTEPSRRLYGIAFGEVTEIDPAWNEFSLPRTMPKELTHNFTLDGQWDAYSIYPLTFLPSNKANSFRITMNDVEGAKNLGRGGITDFLTEHAPQLSTWPGSDEVLSWITVRDGKGSIVAVAALTEWESGGKLLSSVAVDSRLRGNGIGQILVEACVMRAAELGIEHLLLAVERANHGAIRLYEKVGFAVLGRFNHFSR